MKLGIFFISISFAFLGFSQGLQKEEKLASSILIEDKTAFFVFSDGSFWKVLSFVKRARSLGEWWKNVQLAPENYETNPGDWFVGFDITIFSKFEALEVKESDAVNQESLKYCSHLL